MEVIIVLLFRLLRMIFLCEFAACESWPVEIMLRIHFGQLLVADATWLVWRFIYALWMQLFAHTIGDLAICFGEVCAHPMFGHLCIIKVRELLGTSTSRTINS
eukprot:1062998_1